jgi:hypothetical protein
MLHFLTIPIFAAANNWANELLSEACLEARITIDIEQPFVFSGIDIDIDQEPLGGDNPNDEEEDDDLDVNSVDYRTASAIMPSILFDVWLLSLICLDWIWDVPTLISAYLAYKGSDAMEVDATSETPHIFQVNVLGLRGGYYDLISHRILIALESMSVTSQFPRTKMKRPMLHLFKMVFLEPLPLNLLLHLCWNLWSFTISLIIVMQVLVYRHSLKFCVHYKM